MKLRNIICHMCKLINIIYDSWILSILSICMIYVLCLILVSFIVFGLIL
jgi:hypothetical protein